MSTKISIQIEPIVHGETAVTDAGLVVKDLESGEVFGAMKSVDKQLVAASTLTAVNIFFIKSATATVNLRCTVTRVPAAVPSTPVMVQDGAAAPYALAGGVGQMNNIAVLTDLSSLTGIVQDDMLGLGLVRDENDSGNFMIVRIEFVLSEPTVLNSCDIITVAEAKDFLKIGVDAPDTTLDAFLQKWITIFSKGAEEYTGRKFRQQTILAEIHDGTGTQKQWTHWAPIYAFVHEDITQDVLYRVSPASAFIPLETDANYIFINDEEPWYVLMYRRMFYALMQNIKMNYMVGYSSTPSRIMDVVFQMMQLLLHESKRGDSNLVVQSSSVSEAGVTFNTIYRKLKPEHQAILNEYRRPML